MLATTATFALPLLEGVILIGIAFGAALDATFREMDLSAEQAGYRAHLHIAEVGVATRKTRASSPLY